MSVLLTERYSYGKSAGRYPLCGEERGIVSSLTAKLPFEETLNLKDIINGDKMCLKWEIEDLTIRLIHSRKLNIKALVTFVRLWMKRNRSACRWRWMQKRYPSEKTVRFLGLTVHKKDTLRIKDEYTIASNRPDIASLIWYTMDVRGLDLKPEENVVKARGELSVLCCTELKIQKPRCSGWNIRCLFPEKWNVRTARRS